MIEVAGEPHIAVVEAHDVKALRGEHFAEPLGPHDQLHAEPHHEDDGWIGWIAEGLVLKRDLVSLDRRHGMDRGRATCATRRDGTAASGPRAARGDRRLRTRLPDSLPCQCGSR